MKKKILLIYPETDVDKNSRFGFSLNLLIIGSILFDEEFEVEYKDFTFEKYNQTKFVDDIKKYDLFIIEIDSFPLKRSINLNNATQIIDIIRERKSEAKIIAFGKDCILFPRYINNTNLTYIGEIEKEIGFICKNLFENECSFSKSCILNNAQHDYQIELVDDLNKLPIPKRDLTDKYFELSNKPNIPKSTIIQTSRGCNAGCSFCQRNGWHFEKIRFRNVDLIIEEFKKIIDSSYKNVWICDDNFTFNLKRAKQILNGLIKIYSKNYLSIALSSWVKIDEEFLELSKNAGVSIISFGIESGVQKILDYYNKPIKIEEVSKIINLANEKGIYSVGNFIFGAPTETIEDIEQTIDFAINIPLDNVNFKILSYMAGSKIWKNAVKENKIEPDIRIVYATKENGLSQFTFDELKNFCNNAKEKFNSNVKRKTNLLKKMLNKLPYYK